MTGMQRIERERARQIASEGFDANRDDQEHQTGELAQAARSYEWEGHLKRKPMEWPWDGGWWKPKDRLRNLERAGALYLAEADRMKRRAEHVAEKIDYELLEKGTQ